jgi:hypothetical protein
MLTQTGYLTIVYAAPVAMRDAAAPNGLRVEEQISLTLKAAADDREYQYNLPITEKAVGLQQLEAWANERTLVTVFASSLRALPFVHDTAKDEQGNPIKKYQRAGRKVKVAGDLTIETDAFVIFSAYDVRPAGQVDTSKEAQAAAASYARQQAEFRKRSVQARIEKARQRVAEQQEAAAKAAAEVAAKGGPAAASGATSGGARRSA